jgi:hypothetical protein
MYLSGVLRNFTAVQVRNNSTESYQIIYKLLCFDIWGRTSSSESVSNFFHIFIQTPPKIMKFNQIVNLSTINVKQHNILMQRIKVFKIITILVLQ